MKTISVITNNKVDKTFEGVECLLLRTVISVLKERNTKKFIIKTERVNYEDVEVPQFNEDLTPVLDADENQVTVTESVLKVIDKKDKEGVRIMNFDEINTLHDQIKTQIPDGLTKMEQENLEEQLALLEITKQEKPWGTLESDWQVL